MKKIFCILFMLFIWWNMYAAPFDYLMINFAKSKDMEFVGSLYGKFTDSNKVEAISFFRKTPDFVYSVYFFTINNEMDYAYKEIIEFWNSDGGSAISQKVASNYNCLGSLGFSADINKNGYEELIINRNLWGTEPIIIEYNKTDKQFAKVWKNNKFPDSMVITPGAPNEYKFVELVDIQNDKLHLIRHQSDFRQHFYLEWDEKNNEYDLCENQDFFLQMGFWDSKEEDLQCLNKELDESYLYKLSSKKLRLLRNSIYARHGYIFQTWDLVDDFSRCIWYKKNQSFEEADLSDLEKKQIQTIKNIESKKGVYKPIEWELIFSEN